MANLNHLIQTWLQGDDNAAEQIYYMHRDQTFRLCFAILGSREDAEEATQDTLSYALLNTHRYDPNRSKFSTWLYTITISKCRDMQRKRISHSGKFLAWLNKSKHISVTTVTPETELIYNETQSIVLHALQQLSPVTREAVILRHWGGHTYAEIAEIVGCSMKTAQSRVRIAHEQLGKILNPKDVFMIVENSI